MLLTIQSDDTAPFCANTQIECCAGGGACIGGQICDRSSSAGVLAGCRDPDGLLCGCNINDYACRPTDEFKCCGSRYSSESFWCRTDQNCGDGKCENPEQIKEVGSFTAKGCYPDSPVSRVLTAGSASDLTSAGMTVEKCAAHALGWRYSAVEYSG